MAGLGRDTATRLPVDSQGRIRADIRLPELKGPAILCLQAGNVNSGAFDPAEPLIKWAKQAEGVVLVSRVACRTLLSSQTRVCEQPGCMSTERLACTHWRVPNTAPWQRDFSVQIPGLPTAING